MQSSTINRLVFVAAFAGGIWLGLTAADGAAHADDTPAATATQRPGGALGVVEDVVDEVLPKPPAEAKPEPAKTPEHAEPEHSTEPTRAPEPEDEPAEEPADDPVTDDRPRDPGPTPTTTPPVVIDVPPVVVDVPPVVVDVPPVEVITTPPPAPVVLPTPPPVVAPVPTPTTPAPEQPSSPLPVEVDLPTEPPPAPAVPAVPALPSVPELPVVIGPIAAPAQPVDDGIYPPGVLPEPAPPIATCDDPVHEDDPAPGRSGGDGKTQRRPANQPGGDATKKTRPVKPCPAPAGPDGQAAAVGAVKPPPPTGEQLVTDSVAGAYSSPVLQRLHQLRGRSHTLAGRTEHPEPGPA